MIKNTVRALLFLFILFLHQGVYAQSSIAVIESKATVDFPGIIRFDLKARSDQEIEKVSLYYGTNAMSCQDSTSQQVIDFEPGKDIDVSWEWELKRSGALPPGAEIEWYWLITDAAGNSLQTDPQSLTIQDNRHKWQSIETDDQKARIQWYVGNQNFGKTLASITQESLQRLAKEIGVESSRPILITIYPSSEEVRDAMITAQEWAGGVAFPEYGSIIIGATQNDEVWLKSVIPHELAHLLVGELTFNCKGVRLTTWLSEGLSVFSEGPLSKSQLDGITQALEEDRLRPLHALERGFSPSGDQARLEYDQSGAVVQYLVEAYGTEKMADLLGAMQSGLLINPALEQVYGFDTDGLDSAWRVDLGFAPLPTAAATAEKSDATPIPTLALYTSVVQATSTGTLEPPASSPTAAAVTQTNTPEPPTVAPEAAAVSPTAAETSGGGGLPFCSSPLLIALFILSGIYLLIRRVK
jgi:hypothetical protein